eukprot:9488391-Pyramimonas_sp.AAC.3
MPVPREPGHLRKEQKMGFPVTSCRRPRSCRWVSSRRAYACMASPSSTAMYTSESTLGTRATAGLTRHTPRSGAPSTPSTTPAKKGVRRGSGGDPEGVQIRFGRGRER